MSQSAKSPDLRDLRERAERIRLAAAEGVRAALRRHMLLGESVVVAGENGGVRWLGPEEIRCVGGGFRQGLEEAARRLKRVLTNDPAIGVFRHADAAYEMTVRCTREQGFQVPLE